MVLNKFDLLFSKYFKKYFKRQVMGGIKVGVAKQKGVICLGPCPSLNIYPFIFLDCLSSFGDVFCSFFSTVLSPIKWKLQIEGDA